MTRTLVFLAVLLSCCLVLLLVTSSRSLTAQSWQPYRGGFEPVAGATYSPVPLYLPSPIATPVVAPSQTPKSGPRRTPAPTGSIGTAYVGVKGVAGIGTWYRYHRGQAAAAARLRDALGPNWRGMSVQVCHLHSCIEVVLTDYESSQIPGRLIDLDSRDFAAICGPLSKGVCAVVVTH